MPTQIKNEIANRTANEANGTQPNSGSYRGWRLGQGEEEVEEGRGGGNVCACAEAAKEN
ncbi:GH24625 [Drosophila grimshawi]|uniref:GH24625 n=1 Tax=Drosophila grimshawi TaxID=7222 RepID=B4JMF7_DROGR|nr:GH24625 [Drosophila grimshawi]